MEQIDIKFAIEERDLIINQTFADDHLIERLQKAELTGKYIKVSYSLYEIDDLAGFIATEANHAEDEELQNKLDDLYYKLSEIEDNYN